MSTHIPDSGSDDEILNTAALEAVRKRVPLVVDRPLQLTSKWTPPANLVVVGDSSENSVICCAAPGSGIDIVAPISMDGVIVDGGLDPGEDRSEGDYGSLLSIRGSTAPFATYLDGVRIGRIVVRRTRLVAIVLANLRGFIASRIEISDIFCTGIIISGLKDGRIGSLIAKNIGELKETGHRRGSAVAIMAETKPIERWYDTNYILATETLDIDHVEVTGTTDSGFYIHDERKRGVEAVTVGIMLLDTCGKDGFKTRAGPRHIRIGSLTAQRIGMRGVNIESDDVVIGRTVIGKCGHDAVGDILGRPASYTGGDGKGETIQTHPGGVTVFRCRDISLPDVSIRGVSENPATRAEGHAIHLMEVERVSIRGYVETCDGNGLRIAGCSDFDIDLSLADTCRSTRRLHPIQFARATGRGSSRGQISVKLLDVNGDPSAQPIAGDAVCETRISLKLPSEMLTEYPRIDPNRPCGEGNAP